MDTTHIPTQAGAATLLGGVWITEKRSALLRVPSAVIPEAFNLLLNPLHPDMARIVVGEPEPFSFDEGSLY